LIAAMPNFPLYFRLIDAFTKGDMKGLSDMISDVDKGCTDTSVLGTFAENHDLPRFASLVPDMALAKNAIAFTILADGIPTSKSRFYPCLCPSDTCPQYTKAKSNTYLAITRRTIERPCGLVPAVEPHTTPPPHCITSRQPSTPSATTPSSSTPATSPTTPRNFTWTPPPWPPERDPMASKS
jgi:Alpha amylase, catalytic domain